MSRQPRKIFGFTGAAKYGPVANEGDKEAPKAPGDMSRKGKPAKKGRCERLCDPDEDFCQCVKCILTCDCS